MNIREVLAQVAGDISFDLGNDYGLGLFDMDECELGVTYPLVDDSGDTKDSLGNEYGHVIFSREKYEHGYFGFVYRFDIETSFDGSWSHNINIPQYL